MSARTDCLKNNDFSEQLDAFSAVLRTSSNFFWQLYIYPLLLRIWYKHLKIIREVRRTGAGCIRKDCPKNTECLQLHLEIAITTRGALRELSTDTNRSIVFKPARVIVQNALTDWDDLIVDLTISKDKEIDELITLIADAV